MKDTLPSQREINSKSADIIRESRSCKGLQGSELTRIGLGTKERKQRYRFQTGSGD